MKKTLLASAILLAFATTTAVAAETVSLKGGTFSSTVQVDGQAVDFTSAVTLKGTATIDGKDGALVDVNVNGTFTNQSTAEVDIGDLTTTGYLYTTAGSVLNAKDIVTAGLAYSNAGTINADSLTITTGQQSKETVNVDKLVVVSSMHFTDSSLVSIKDTLAVDGNQVILGGKGTVTQTIKNIELSQKYDGGYRSEVQLDGVNLESTNVNVADNAWGLIGILGAGDTFEGNIENVTVGKDAVFGVYGSSAKAEDLRIGTATFAGGSGFIGYATSYPDKRNFDNLTIENLVINGDTKFAKHGDIVVNNRFDYDFYNRGIINFKVGTIVLNEGKLTMGQDIEGLDGTLSVVVNDGSSVAFTSNVKADEVAIQLNTLAAGAVDAASAVIDSESTVVTIPGELNEGSGVVEQVKQALVFGDNSYEATVAEGMYNDALKITADGTVVKTLNSLMSNVLDMASVQSVSLNRVLMNDVRKRLGDIRSAQGTHGVWARYDGGRLSGGMGLENDFHTLQFGIDTVPVADAPRFGVAFSYTQSDADLKRGGAEMDAFGLAVYATKMYDNGAFVDVIGRIATADTDIVVDGDKKGAMDNLALSLSGEFGWRFNMTERHYVEPQVEVTYTRVNNSDLTLNNGSNYAFKAVDSLVGRAGFAAGFTCPNNMGDVYVRASVVHEFMGDATVRGGSAVHELNGGDTWFEYGIGANFNVNKNTYVFADIERTTGAALDEDWRANVGVRYSF